MVNDLRRLLRDSVTAPPPDRMRMTDVLGTGKRKVRRRRTAALAGVAAAVIGIVGLAGLVGGGMSPRPDDSSVADRSNDPVGRVLRLDDAEAAKEGRDYDVLTTQTNAHLDQENGQYFDGFTDDGLVFVQDGPRGKDSRVRYGLLDPETGIRSWLPTPPVHLEQPIHLGRYRLLLRAAAAPAGENGPGVWSYDRRTRQWRHLEWPDLPAGAEYSGTVLGPDNRLYVGLASGSDGETFDLWSVAIDDPADVRDEKTEVGDFDIAGTRLVWTDVSSRPISKVTVRDLETDEEDSFDPQSGDRCNQLELQATATRIVLTEHCGTKDRVRDDRIQVVDYDGEPVLTVRGDGSDIAQAGDDRLLVDSYGPKPGSYLYRFDTGDWLRVTEETSRYGLINDAWADLQTWHTPANGWRGAKQWVVRLK
ncbi:hypothetical protein [Nocardioides speluncae]|uniref:hypothetical protein n=1 Tax=Nocardioides speluncae TaxID=2670337 RepID=UPI000D69EB14|nr:hypothetical protein [Nocardioides speluncae]